MKIAFPVGTLSYRGTHVALHDYASFNQKILGNESLICIDAQQPGPEDLVQRFKNQFECVLTDSWSDISKKSIETGCDAVYILKSGERDHQLVPDIPNLIHAVFPQHVREQHGSVYAFVSEWLSSECSNGSLPFVPHMIHLPEVATDLREELGIPRDATVFGCYGGFDSFDIEFVHKVVGKTCHTNNHLWFIFMNIRPFIEHEHVLFLPASTDSVRKRRFIQTCDAMLHGRGMGESFGLACGEFSMCNRPVITYGLSPQRAHLHMLAEKALIYRGPAELQRCLLEFDRCWASQQDWDRYSQSYGPETVMRNFSSVFLNTDIWNANEKRVSPGLGVSDFLSVEWSHVKRRLRSNTRKYHHRYS